MDVTYHGWSGLTFAHGDVSVTFDPPTPAAIGNAAGQAVVCVSHGHPDHFDGLRRLAKSGAGELLARTHVVSTPEVIRPLTHSGIRHMHTVRDGESVTVGGVEIDAFCCEHMSLLPPEPRLKVDFVRRFLSHPFTLGRLAWEGRGAPIQSPMLGFAVTFEDGTRIVNLGEGLHRETDLRPIIDVAKRYRPTIVCFAIEPEDVDLVTTWLSILDAPTVLIYEAHRPWRDAFGLGHVELQRLCAELAGRVGRSDVVGLTRPGTRTISTHHEQESA